MATPQGLESHRATQAIQISGHRGGSRRFWFIALPRRLTAFQRDGFPLVAINITISHWNETRSWFLDVPYLPYTSCVGGAEQTWASEDKCRKLD
jgi:hypothetical protein